MDKRFNNVICYLVMFLFSLVLTLISPFFSDIANSFHMNVTDAGFLFSVNNLGFIIFIFIAGFLVERYGKKRMISASLLGLAASLILFAKADNFTAGCVFYFIAGGFNGILLSQVNALVAELNPVNTHYYINKASVFSGIGPLFGPILTLIMLYNGFSWRTCFMLVGVLSLLLFLGFCFIKPESKSPAESIDMSGTVRLLADRRFILVCICIMLYSGSEVSGWGWLSEFLETSLNYSYVYQCILLALFWLAMIISRIVCSRLSLRIDILRLLLVLSVSSAAVVCFSGFFTNRITVWLAVPAMGLSYSNQWSLLISYGQKRLQTAKGSGYAVMVGCDGIGIALIPYLMGLLSQFGGIRMGMGFPSVLFLFIAGFALTELIRKKKQAN